MTGTNDAAGAAVERELFYMLYTLAVLQKLIDDKLLFVKFVPILQSKGHNTLIDLSKKFAPPEYKLLATYAYQTLLHYDKNLSFSSQNLEKLFEEAQVNNGYIL